MKKLLIGPWSGEFGWEICTWVPYARYISMLYEKTVVICQPGHEYLYGDFATGFVNFQYKGNGDNWAFDRHPSVGPFMPKKIKKKYPDYCLKIPSENRCMHRDKKRYKRYGEKNDLYKYDIVIHARATDKYGQHVRNYPPSKYEKIVKNFKGLRMCSVGTRAYHIGGTKDKRNISMKELCDIFASSRLVIGTSSGPMHLASYCGAPHLVITGNEIQKAIKTTNRMRYELLWNPFESPCYVLDAHNWKPPVDLVIKTIEDALK